MRPRWWCVRCTACRWANYRAGTHEEITRHGCPRCGKPILVVARSFWTPFGDAMAGRIP